MKIWLAGNIPGRVKEEQYLVSQGLKPLWLVSYFYFVKDISMRKVFQYWGLK